jgi:hypothetical protein
VSGVADSYSTDGDSRRQSATPSIVYPATEDGLPPGGSPGPSPQATCCPPMKLAYLQGHTRHAWPPDSNTTDAAIAPLARSSHPSWLDLPTPQHDIEVSHYE